ALSRRRRMLGRADELAASLETSTPLGADGSRLPAIAIFFQHFGQRDILAAAFVFYFAGRDKNFLRAADGDCVFAFADCSRAKFAKAVHAGTPIDFSILDRAGERFAANGDLVLRVRRKHRRMARTKNENAPRWNFGN